MTYAADEIGQLMARRDLLTDQGAALEAKRTALDAVIAASESRSDALAEALHEISRKQAVLKGLMELVEANDAALQAGLGDETTFLRNLRDAVGTARGVLSDRDLEEIMALLNASSPERETTAIERSE